MSVNVVERILGRLLPAAGTARTTPFHDRWESGEAINEIRREGYNEAEQPQAPPVSTLNCPSLFSRGKKQRRTQGLRLSTIAKGTEDDEHGSQPEAPSDNGEDGNAQPATMASVKAAMIVAHGSFNPIHNHHIAMMITARKRLEEEGFVVLRGLIGLSSQKALEAECEWALSQEERLHCIHSACDDNEEAKGWIQGDPQGTRFKSGSKYRAHMQEGEDDRTMSPLEQDVPVFKVIGEDVEERFPKEIIGPTIVVGRGNANMTATPTKAAHDVLLRCD